MNPINPIFSDDYQKFVLQNQLPLPPIVVDHSNAAAKKKFSLDTSKNTKKTKAKEDSPWLPKKPKKEEEEEV